MVLAASRVWREKGVSQAGGSFHRLESMRTTVSPAGAARSVPTSALRVVLLGCLVALILPLASSNAPARTTELAAEDGKSDAALEAEQSKEEERLVEAAKRRYESLKHRAGAIKL
eukprot:3760344-Rhodomonas_salina.5